MKWYYSKGQEKIGPISEKEFNALVETSTIKDDTLVWNESMEDWITLAESRNSTDMQLTTEESPCRECGKSFPQNKMIKYENQYVCAACKPNFLQKAQEGISLNNDMLYVGVRDRFGAKVLDNILVFILQIAIAVPVGMMGEGSFIAALTLLVTYGTAFAYGIFFLGKYGATPGKMAIGAKVVQEDGSAIGYGQATGRVFAEILSGLIMAIGYIMAAWDDEKRTLHDRICNTRVVKK